MHYNANICSTVMTVMTKTKKQTTYHCMYGQTIPSVYLLHSCIAFFSCGSASYHTGYINLPNLVQKRKLPAGDGVLQDDIHFNNKIFNFF